MRLEYQGEVWVASGDYKVEPDGTCAPFEPVRCHTFITESTFGLPIYRWQPQAQVFAGINDWWQANIAAGKASVLFCYSFGKAQRILHGIDASIGPILSRTVGDHHPFGTGLFDGPQQPGPVGVV